MIPWPLYELAGKSSLCLGKLPETPLLYLMADVLRDLGRVLIVDHPDITVVDKKSVINEARSYR
jgi:hypothetical protein